MTSSSNNLRWQLNVLLLSGIFIAYTLRVNISVAVGVICEEYGWTVSQKGTLLSCFYWGYTVGQIPLSLMGQLYGGKWIFGLSVLIPSILTLFIPLAASTSFEIVVILRVFMGLFAAGMFPAVYSFFRNWIPSDERTLSISFIYSGIYLGEIVSFPICGVLVGATIDPFGGWESCFYLFGLIGVLWFPFWCFLAYESPLVHPRISPDELRRINQGKRMVTIGELDKLIAEEVARRTARREEALRLQQEQQQQQLEKPQLKNITTTYGVSQFGSPAEESASTKLKEALEVVAAEQAREAAVDTKDNEAKAAEEGQRIDPSLLGAFISTVRKMSASSRDEAAKAILPDGTPASDVVLDLSQVDVESPLTEMRRPSLTVDTAATGITATNNNNDNNNGTHVDDVAAVRRASSGSASGSKEPKVAALTVGNLAQHDVEVEKMSPKNNVVTNKEREEDVVSFLSDDDHAVEIAERTPWLAFFTTPAVWNLYFASFTTDWIGFILLAEMPTFLVKMLGFSEEDSGILSTPPYCAMFVSVLLSGYIFEHLEKHYGWRTATVRMVAQCLAVGGSSACLLIVVYCGDVNTSYAFLIIAMLFYGSLNSGVGCGYTDISPNFSFSMNTIGNTMSSAGGMATPLVVSAFTTAYPGMEGWRVSFLLTAALSVLSLLIWYFFSKSSVIDVLNTPTPKKRHRDGRKEGREKAQQRRKSKTEERARRANERRRSRNGGSQLGSPFGSPVGSRVGSPFASPVVSPVASRANSVVDESTACDAV